MVRAKKPKIREFFMTEQKHQTPDSLIKKVRTWETWLKKWEMNSLKISVPYLQMEWKPQEADKDAAWELYIELLTRITTQPLLMEHGDEKTSLESIYSLFGLTRHIIKRLD